MRLASIPDRVQTLFTTRIWEARLEDLPRARAFAYRVGRVVAATVQGFLGNDLTLRAAALTYYSVLSIVPFLAFAFAVLKGFGAYHTFIDTTVSPYVQETFAANAPLHDAIDRILRFVDRTDVSRLGTAGMIALVYTSVTLVANVEVALNHVFGARRQRPLLRQVTDYVTLLVTTPILLLAATTASAAAENSRSMELLRGTLGLGSVIDTMLGLTSTVVVVIALFATYEILPNVRVRPLSALVGAVLAGILWQAALVLQIHLQVGVARYSAMYSVLGAIPIFFVWTYVSWLIVLVGAQIAATHQDEQAVRQRLRSGGEDQALKEALAVAVGAEVAHRFVAGGPRPTQAELAATLDAAPSLLDEVLRALVSAGLVVRAVADPETTYVPGRDLDAVRVADLVDALRRDPARRAVRERVVRQLGVGLEHVVLELEEAVRASPANVTLRQLAAAVPGEGRRRAGGAPPPAGTTAGHEPGSFDPKQTELPG